jgi:translation elongation factor P/translation initiation factor 5A
MIRNQVVDGCNSTELRRKLLAVDNLTLDKVRKIARTYELSVTHGSKMYKGEDSTKDPKEEEVNKVQKKKRTQFKPRAAPRTFNRPPPTNFARRTVQCYRCGRSGHYVKECQITRDAVCRQCGKSGHFAKVCKTKQFTTGKVNSLNQYFEEESDQDIFTLSGKDDAIISIEIEGQSINFLIDSGSYINAIDKQTFEKLKTRKSMLEKTTISIWQFKTNTVNRKNQNESNCKQ